MIRNVYILVSCERETNQKQSLESTVLYCPVPFADDEMGRIPEDWVVVVAQRPGPKRAIVGIKEIEEQVIAMFPPHRVAVFTGSMPILEGTPLHHLKL